MFCLVGDYAISEIFIIANRVLIDAAAIAGVALDGVDNAVFDFLDDANMIGLTVLRAGAALVVPIEEDNHAGRGLHGVIRPLPTLPEPLDAVDTSRIFRDNAGFDIATLICTPRNEASAPFYTASEAIPRPIRLTAHIAHLRKSDGDNLILAITNAVKDCRPKGIVFVLE